MYHRKGVRKITTPKKIGRPKSKNPMSETIRVRLDVDLHNKLMNFCEKENLEKSEVIRMGLRKILETNKKK